MSQHACGGVWRHPAPGLWQLRLRWLWITRLRGEPLIAWLCIGGRKPLAHLSGWRRALRVPTVRLRLWPRRWRDVLHAIGCAGGSLWRAARGAVVAMVRGARR